MTIPFDWSKPPRGVFDWTVPPAGEDKAFNPNQPRRPDGRFGSGPAKTTIGQAYADALKITGSHKISVNSSRVRKYKGHDTVESFVANHKRGRAAALRELAADHVAGKIDLHAAAPVARKPAAASPKPAAKPAPKPGGGPTAAAFDAGRKIRGEAVRAKPGASLAPLPRDARRSDLDTLRAAHAQIAEPGDAVRLSHVRQVLGNYSRPEQDRMLQSALMTGHRSGVSLSQISDNKEIDQIEKDAQLYDYNILRANGYGRKSVEGLTVGQDVDGPDDPSPPVSDDKLRELFHPDLLRSAGLSPWPDLPASSKLGTA